ncbi:MAG: hypothetical protein AAGF85_11780 [Bacteroidota bacterium]
MKLRITVILIMLNYQAVGQYGNSIYSEARKATAAFENQQRVHDSLKTIYIGRWTLDLTYGQRFISASNKAAIPDTVTFTDFTEKRSFFGLGVGYFIASNFQLGLGLNITFLPKKQEITSISFGSGGITAEGGGSGGLITNLTLAAKYFFTKWKYTKPYVSVELGTVNATAKGGKGILNLSNPRDDIVNKLSARYAIGNVLLGVNHRATPVFMLDFNIGYSMTPNQEPIGGIVSPGGITTSATMRFILNPRKTPK